MCHGLYTPTRTLSLCCSASLHLLSSPNLHWPPPCNCINLSLQKFAKKFLTCKRITKEFVNDDDDGSISQRWSFPQSLPPGPGFLMHGRIAFGIIERNAMSAVKI